MTQAYYLTDFFSEAINDYRTLMKDMKQDFKDYLKETKNNFFTAIKNIADKVSETIDDKINGTYTNQTRTPAPNYYYSNYTLDDVLSSFIDPIKYNQTQQSNQNVRQTQTAQTQATTQNSNAAQTVNPCQINQVVPTPVLTYPNVNSASATPINNNYKLPEQYTKAVRKIRTKESEKEISDILMGTKNEYKTWNERINELGNQTKKYDSKVIDKYKDALKRNKYLRYSKKKEYQTAMSALDALKA